MSIRELLSLSLRAPEPQRLAAELELQQLQKAPLTASFVDSMLNMFLVVPNVDRTPRNPVEVDSDDSDLRLLAVLWLKHYIKQQWRAHKKTNMLNDAERDHIRGVLLFAALHEPHQTVALHLSFIVAIIARADFSSQWSFEELFSVMMQPLRRPHGAVDMVAERRSVDVCYRVIKELAARRLMQHRKQFAMMSVEMLPLLLQYWTVTATQLNNYLQTEEGAIRETIVEKLEKLCAVTGAQQLHVLVRTTKLISTMLLHAFRDLSTVQNGELIRSALIEFYKQLESIVKFRHAFEAQIEKFSRIKHTSKMEEATQTLDKYMHHIAAIVVEVQHAYPVEFRQYLSPYLTLFWNVLNVFSSTSLTVLAAPKRLQIDALNFFANVLSCRLYKNESLMRSDGTTRIIAKVITAAGEVALTDTMVIEAQTSLQNFFTQTENRFKSMINLLIMHYMMLTPGDLDKWLSEPETYFALMESLTAKESVRSCAENLYLTVVQNFPGQTIPALTQIVSSIAAYLIELGRGQISTAGDDGRVLEIDAVLVAIGLGCYDLHDCFEFEPWFLANLVPILINQDAAVGSFRGLPILRYRIVWLVSCYLAQLSTSVRPPLYDALLNLPVFQQTDTGVALSLRIIQTLESMVSDWGFEYDPFAQFLPRSLEYLFATFPQAVELESQMKIFDCLEAIIQACGAHILKFSQKVIGPLPTIWASESDASNLVRSKILRLMTKLVSCLKGLHYDVSLEAGDTDALLAMSTQLIHFSTDVSNPDHVCLVESGLELWNETVDASTVYTKEFHVLFSQTMYLMDRDYEHVVLLLRLLKNYVRLGKIQFWHDHQTIVCKLLLGVIGNVKAEASLQIAQVAEDIVATISIDQLSSIVPVVKSMVRSCIQSQHVKANHEPESVLAAYLSVLARLMVTSIDFTLNVVLMNDHIVLAVLVNVMLRLFYTVGESQLTLLRRKLWAAALCLISMMAEQQMLEKIGQVLEICAEVINDEPEERAEQEAVVDSSEKIDQSEVFGVEQAGFTNHQQNLSEQDASVLALDLRSFVCERMNILASKLGRSAFDQILETVDISVLRKFQA
ncbi:Nuclear transport receptor KAP120 (importin beta superfamily) [Plasmopara halstedii]|uniref:Nuclear transport receptor KAP120 (Importin beta superfamily) n=1 Tax=Plasmopara halstedii TaxID=4781 RepID=A0A0P1A6V4_PLAHL|nr:Nuclear transport receptor KAP120 (importin beta superfamily) [Plasmopara halstedii]CEG35873.1 Nuclear transport receptor KAP120 (importin beta superfamily) [Plasmopara halstedii]|eukprot:XP_024572242.1 Nuclear transport receptor KAP120 (importin beta superfamily) [Plasmopara halstedii]